MNQRNMGRPHKISSDAKYTERVTILVSPSQRAWLEKQASEQNKTIASVMRGWLDTQMGEAANGMGKH